MRSAFAPFAASIAAHSSFEWQVRVMKFEPVTGALRQTGFSGFGVVTGVASGVLVAVDCANPAFELSTNAAAIISFIMRLQYVRGAYLHRSWKQHCCRSPSVLAAGSAYYQRGAACRVKFTR